MGRRRTQQITHQTGTIVSHRGYSHEEYPNYADSVLKIDTDGILILTVTVINFQLYLKKYCYDYLEIKGHKYCGTDLASNRRTTFVSATGVLRLKFYTSSVNQDEGFRLDYDYYSTGKFTRQYRLLACVIPEYILNSEP